MSDKAGSRQGRGSDGDERPAPNTPDEDRPIDRRPTQARAGQILHAGQMRRVLVISLVLIIVAFAAVYLIFFGMPGDEATSPPEAPVDEEAGPPNPATQ